MIEWTEDKKKLYKQIKMFAIILLVIEPFIFALLPLIIDHTVDSNGQIDMMYYILLIIAIVSPLIIPLIEKYQLSVLKKLPKEKRRSTTLTVFIQKCAFIDAIYIYGLVIFFMSGDITRTYTFFPIGIIWSLIHYPTESKFEAFLEKVDRYEP